MYEISGFSGGRISEEEFASLREDEKAAAIKKIHQQMYLNAIDSGNLYEFAKKYLEEGVAPNRIAVVYMGRYEYWTPDEKRNEESGSSPDVLCEVLERNHVIRRSDTFRFDPDSEAAKYWRSRMTRFSELPRGERIYRFVAQGMRETNLDLREMSAVFFTHGNGSSFSVNVDHLEVESQKKQTKTKERVDEPTSDT